LRGLLVRWDTELHMSRARLGLKRLNQLHPPGQGLSNALLATPVAYRGEKFFARLKVLKGGGTQQH
jgi:hypothetical protein